MVEAVKEAVSSVVDKIQGHPEEEGSVRQPSPEEFEQLKKKYTGAGQGQVFAFVDELQASDKAQLYDQLSNFDPTRINELADKALNPAKAESGPVSLEPLPEKATASVLDSDPKDIQQWYDEGLQQISGNHVAVVLMAGGQGTRLGSSAPKGCFDIGLPSRKTLFQIQAERIARLQVLAQKATGKEKAIIPWYIMTSGPTRKPTEEFFQQHHFFGLDKSNVIIFEQGVLPCISNEGKVMMESKAKASACIHYAMPKKKKKKKK